MMNKLILTSMLTLLGTVPASAAFYDCNAYDESIRLVIERSGREFDPYEAKLTIFTPDSDSAVLKCEQTGWTSEEKFTFTCDGKGTLGIYRVEMTNEDPRTKLPLARILRDGALVNEIPCN